MRLFYHIRS